MSVIRLFFVPLVLCILSACTPKVQDPDVIPGKHATLDAQVFHTADDAPLPYREWRPSGKPQAVIVAVHGFNDYSRAFETTGTFFKAHRIAVYAYDQRGFGAAPNTGIWAGEENLVGDLKQYIQQLSKCYPHTPIYLLGESMGGAVVIDAVADPSFPKVKGIILSAPAVWGAETMNPIYRGTLWLAAHTIPYKQFTGSNLKIIASNNYPMLKRLVADPLIIKKTRVDAIYGVVHLMDSAYEKVPAVKTPTLLLYGAHDQVIPRMPVESALAHFTVPVEYVYYPDGYHMLLRDLQGELVMRDILSWIRQPKKPLPSGFGELRTSADSAALPN